MKFFLVLPTEIMIEPEKVREIFKDPLVRAGYESFVVAGFAENLQSHIAGFVFPRRENDPVYTPTAEEMLQFFLIKEAIEKFLLVEGCNGDLKKALCTMFTSVPWLAAKCVKSSQ